jgi:hypothetical protein
MNTKVDTTVMDEAAKVNAVPALSDFECTILEDVLSWIHTESKFTIDLTTKDAIIDFWAEKLA